MACFIYPLSWQLILIFVAILQGTFTILFIDLSLSPNTLQLVYLLMFNQRVEHGIFRKMQTVLKKTKHERTNEISTNRPYNVHLVAFIINLSKTV